MYTYNHSNHRHSKRDSMLKQLSIVQGALQRVSIKRSSLTGLCSIGKGCKRMLPTPEHQTVGLDLPLCVKQLAMDAECHQPMDITDVPDVITNNPVWTVLLPQIEELYRVSDNANAVTVLVVLHDSNLKLVLKALPAARAVDACRQIEAELDSGAELPWHPLVATYLVADYDSEDNFCAVIPYAGCTIDSLIHHPEWETSTTPQDRLDTAKLMITQNLMAYAIMQKSGSGYIYRDVKPTNVCVDASLNRISVIDFGLTLKTNMEDFFVGFTHGYYTPETFSTDSQGRPTYYCSSEHRQQATNTTMDVFLTSFMGLEVAVGLAGLPWELRGYAYDLSKHEEQLALMKAHDTAAKSGFKELIARVSCPVAQDFFERTMCADPAQRLTPQQALNHEWLVSCRKAVEQATEAALPALQAQNQQLIEMFSSQLPEVLVPKCHLLQQQEDEQSQEKEQECEETNSVSMSRGSSSVDAPATPSVSQRHISCSVSSAGSSHNDCDDTADDAACEKSSYEVSAAAGVRQSAAPKVQAVRKLLRKLSKGSVIKGIKATLKEVKQQARARVLSCTPGCFAVQTTSSQHLDGCWWQWFSKE